jgi:ribosomal small subunit protein bTHX
MGLFLAATHRNVFYIYDAYSYLKTAEIMGKGDPKTRRGKIINGTYGNRRPHTPAPAPEKTTITPKT